MLCRDTLSSVDDIEEGLDLPTVSPGSLSRAPRSPVLQSPSTMQHPLNCVSILVILLVTVLDLLLQLSTLRCSWLTFPTYFGINETQNVKEYGQLGGGWICVYVPEGTNPNKPFLITVLVSLHTLCMNLTRTYWALVLGLRVVPTPRLITVLRLLIRV